MQIGKSFIMMGTGQTREAQIMSVRSICGVILCSDSPKALSEFYAQVLDIQFEREEHSDLLVHYGVDIGQVHFGIHPPQNMHKGAVGAASTTIAFNVSSLDESMHKAQSRGAQCVSQPRDEGFGMVACFLDPDGNLFELVELNYDFA